MNQKHPSENQSRIMWFALTALSVMAILAVISAIVWGTGRVLNLLSPVLWPLAIGIVAAYLLDPPVSWLERRNVPRPWGIILVFFLAFALVGGVIGSVVPQIVSEASNLAQKFPAYAARAQRSFKNWAEHAEKTAAEENVKSDEELASTNSLAVSTNSTAATTNAPAVTERARQINNKLMSSAADWVSKAVPKIGSWVLGELAKATALIDVAMALILIPVYTFYFLREKRWIKIHWTEYLPARSPRAKEEAVFILTAINQYMIAFFRGQILVALCSGVLYTIGFLAIGLDYAFLLGFLAVLLLIIPYLGAIILCVLSVILTVVQFGDWFHPVLILAIFAIVQSLESFFYSPRIMGNRVGLHPVVVIIAVMVGITLFGGLLGGVFAIPIAAALRVILVRYVWSESKRD
ncbi:MAG TPA: AI-2E family transporter [Verrucomicrobiae bacterium]|nr:AI-2E family transporter [Verrucomicrobiae bacterium]